MLFDTTFLIDLQRETHRREPGKAFAFLKKNPEVTLRISVITVGELSECFPPEQSPALQELLRPYEIIDIDRSIAWTYGQISRELRNKGTKIGNNDLWISAAALVLEHTILTRNQKHFDMIPNLMAVTYKIFDNTVILLYS